MHQLVLGKRFFQNADVVILFFLFEGGPILAEIAAHVNGSHLRVMASYFFYQLQAIFPRHLNVCEDQIRIEEKVGRIPVHTIVSRSHFMTFVL